MSPNDPVECSRHRTLKCLAFGGGGTLHSRRADLGRKEVFSTGHPAAYSICIDMIGEASRRAALKAWRVWWFCATTEESVLIALGNPTVQQTGAFGQSALGVRGLSGSE